MSAACSPAKVRDLVDDGADEVEDQVRDEEEGPGTEGHDAEEELLRGLSVRVLRAGEGGGLTKKPLIHVSTMVRLAGRMENQGMMGRGNVDSKLAGAAETLRGLQHGSGEVVADACYSLMQGGFCGLGCGYQLTIGEHCTR